MVISLRSALTSSCVLGCLFAQSVLSAQLSFKVQRFDNVKHLMGSKDKQKEEEVNVRLAITTDAVQVLRLPSLGVLKTIPCSRVKVVTYSFSKHRRWRAGIAAAVVANVFATPLFFMSGKKHWLTIESEQDHMTLRLDKKNYEKVLVLFEIQTGLTIDRILDD